MKWRLDFVLSTKAIFSDAHAVFLDRVSMNSYTIQTCQSVEVGTKQHISNNNHNTKCAGLPEIRDMNKTALDKWMGFAFLHLLTCHT